MTRWPTRQTCSRPWRGTAGRFCATINGWTRATRRPDANGGRLFGQYEAQKTADLARYEGDRDFPAYNYFSADIGMAHAQRAQVMAWLARLWLVIMALLLLAGSGLVARRTPDFRRSRPARRVAVADVAHDTPPPAAGACR